MIPRRLIARLDVKGSDVIKGVRFEGLRKVGLPDQLAVRYNSDGADELLFIDTVASLYGRNNLKEIVELAATHISIPLTVGGGIRRISDAAELFRSGADKVALNSGAIRNPRLISEVAEMYGSQCVVLSVEAKRTGPNIWEAYIDNGREKTSKEVLDWCTTAIQLGVGEILLTSVDHDGVRGGFDQDLINYVAESVTVPVIAGGGAGSSGDVVEILQNTSVDGVAVASILHYQVTSIIEIKNAIRNAGLPCR